jgi:hypothetical protein
MQGSAKVKIAHNYTAIFICLVMEKKCQVVVLVLYNLRSLRTAARSTSPSPQDELGVTVGYQLWFLV